MEVGREVQTSVSSEPYKTREVRVWQPKHEIHQACISKAPLPKRQREVRALYQDMRPAPRYAGPSSPVFLKHLYSDAMISNARVSLFSPETSHFRAATRELR